MPKLRVARLLRAGLFLVAMPALAQSGANAATKPAPAAAAGKGSEAAPAENAEPGKEGARIDGFRSANFGMTETQLRGAIKKDFNLAGDKISSEENPAERTTVLSVTVPDLLPDAGPARISYILGFKSKKLMQVNIIWSTELGKAAPEKIVSGANALRQYFLGLGFPPEGVIANARAKDGSIIVFEGSDAQKHVVLLRLVGGAPAEKTEAPAPAPVTLLLTYIQDAQTPDVFHIPKGQF